MSSFHEVQAFIDASKKAASATELQSLVETITNEMGFDYYALVHHVDLTHRCSGKLVALSNYPESWIERYVEQNIVANDPVHLASHRTNVGFAWEEVSNLIKVTTAHRKITAETRKAGIADGYTVPANVPGEANGSCSFAMKFGKALPRTNIPMAQLVGSFAFQAARQMIVNAHGPDTLSPPIRLTPRQLECVLLVGKGKSDWEIAKILGIKEDTVTEYLDDARQRYDVGKRIQLVMRAIFDGQIALSDVMN